MSSTRPLQVARLGLMLDISRNRVPTMETLLSLIDGLAALGYNELQLYMEHSFAYRDHATVWAQSSPLTEAEIRILDKACATRGIDLVPNQNTFGHMERWLAHGAYRHLAESPDGFEHPIAGWKASGSTLYPDGASLAFVRGLLDELLPCFRSAYAHVGGDEPWELGKGRSAQRVAAEGKHSVYMAHMAGVFDLVRRHGKRPLFWADVLLERPELVATLPAGALPVIWGYEADSPLAAQSKTLAEAGLGGQFYVAPGAGNWNSFSGRLEVAAANIELAVGSARAHGARGVLLTAWGDNGHHQPWLTLYPALVLTAAAAHGESINRAQLAERIDATFFPQEAPGNGAAICALGQIDGCLPQPSSPCSLLHSAFFATPEVLDGQLRALVTDEDLERCAEAIDAVPHEQLDPEIGFALRCNRFALARLAGRPPPEDRGVLAEAFAQQWRRHCREGGLRESCARILAAADPPSASR